VQNGENVAKTGQIGDMASPSQKFRRKKHHIRARIEGKTSAIY
jgi:hypothetical protein